MNPIPAPPPADDDDELEAGDRRRRRRHVVLGLGAAVLAVVAVLAAGPSLANGLPGLTIPGFPYRPAASTQLDAHLRQLPETHVALREHVAFTRLGLPIWESNPDDDYPVGPIDVHLPGGRTLSLGSGYVQDVALSPDNAYAALLIGGNGSGRLAVVELATGRTSEPHVPASGPMFWAGRTLVLTDFDAPDSHAVLWSFPNGTFPRGQIRRGPDGEVVDSAPAAGQFLVLTTPRPGLRPKKDGYGYLVYDADSLKAVAPGAMPEDTAAPYLMSDDGRVFLGAGENWIRSGSTLRPVSGLPPWVAEDQWATLKGEDGRFVIILAEDMTARDFGPAGVVACDPRGWDGSGTMPCARVEPEGALSDYLRYLATTEVGAEIAEPPGSRPRQDRVDEVLLAGTSRRRTDEFRWLSRSTRTYAIETPTGDRA